jgi:hypothetical protein
MNEILLKLITLIHVIFVLFVVIAPFINSNKILFMHFIFVPFMIFHWILNDNTCALTLMEKKLKEHMGRNTDKDECFTCQIIEPIYDFKKNNADLSSAIYFITIVLWILSGGHLYLRYQNGIINSFTDLFVY